MWCRKMCDVEKVNLVTLISFLVYVHANSKYAMLGLRQSMMMENRDLMMNKEINPNLVSVDNVQNPQNSNKYQISSKNSVLFWVHQG